VNNPGTRYALANPVLWGAFFAYLLISGLTLAHHEMWGDEIHSWNIAKASGSFFELISNTRYEGHPPLWYVVLWSISKFTHDPGYVQVVHLFIACLVVFLVLFYSPFPFLWKMLIPFGYFFLFEYSIISRNYSMAVLFTFLACLVIQKKFRGKRLLFSLLFFLLSNTHLMGLLLAAGLLFYYLLIEFEQKKKPASVLIPLFTGIIILLPSAWFIYPPPDSSLNTDYWIERWNMQQLSSVAQAPLRAFVPMPAWWQYHCWDTQFLLEAQPDVKILKWLNPFLSLLVLIMAFAILRKNKKSLLFFLFALFLFFIVSVFLPFTNARHAGFIFISILAALWFYCAENKPNRNQHLFVIAVLGMQIIAGLFMVVKDMRLPFSNASQVKTLLKKIPSGEKIVTDYWCLNNLAAFTGKAWYCTDLQREASFLLWNSEMAAMLQRKNRYSDGINAFLKKEPAEKVYMLSIHPPERLNRLDDRLTALFEVKLQDKKDDAMEKGGNLYLYEISSKKIHQP